jgi:hypothetical protein
MPGPGFLGWAAGWRYSELPNVFSRDKKAETYVVHTSNEFQKVLDSPHSGMVFVECVMDKYDAPLHLILGGHAIADTDYGACGPQTAMNAQIPLPTTTRVSRLTLLMSGVRHGRAGGRACSPRPLPNRRQRVEVRDQDPFSVAVQHPAAI